jgi:hypothetical protein
VAHLVEAVKHYGFLTTAEIAIKGFVSILFRPTTSTTVACYNPSSVGIGDLSDRVRCEWKQRSAKEILIVDDGGDVLSLLNLNPRR